MTKEIPSFENDTEKMIDFWNLSKDEFLASYSYLSETEYDATAEKVHKLADFSVRPIKQVEQKYTFAQSQQISMQTGLIGYLRADMDSSGKGFFSSWNNFRSDLKTDEFKEEFDNVINSLREKGNFLSNRDTLNRFCNITPEGRYWDPADHYGVRVDTEKYSYLMRLNPKRANTTSIATVISRIGLMTTFCEQKTVFASLTANIMSNFAFLMEMKFE